MKFLDVLLPALIADLTCSLFFCNKPVVSRDADQLHLFFAPVLLCLKGLDRCKLMRVMRPPHGGAAVVSLACCYCAQGKLCDVKDKLYTAVAVEEEIIEKDPFYLRKNTF